MIRSSPLLPRAIVAALLCLVACMPVAAQQGGAAPAGAKAAEGPDLSAERERIKAERARIDAAKGQEERACQDRFAVNDCMNAAKRRWREPLADLRRQENALNDQERRRRSADQVRQNGERAAQAQADAAQRREKALQDQKDREARAASKAGGPQPTGQPREQAQGERPASGPSEARAAANASERARKVREAQERKQRAQARAAQESGKGKPLPVAP